MEAPGCTGSGGHWGVPGGSRGLGAIPEPGRDLSVSLCPPAWLVVPKAEVTPEEDGEDAEDPELHGSGEAMALTPALPGEPRERWGHTGTVTLAWGWWQRWLLGGWSPCPQGQWLCQVLEVTVTVSLVPLALVVTGCGASGGSASLGDSPRVPVPVAVPGHAGIAMSPRCPRRGLAGAEGEGGGGGGG